MNEQWKQLKETIIEIRDNNKFDHKDVSSICQFLANYMNILEERMSNSESLNKWIPVSERLPEEGQRVLVTQIVRKRTIVYVTTFPFEKIKEKYIIAWLPLPKPYKVEKESEE